MRIELFWNVRLLCERLALASQRQRRKSRLRNTPASVLPHEFIGTLELLELARPLGIKAIYDIGAHTGTWTLLAKSIFPDAVVEAFEPLPEHLERFRHTCRALTSVRVHGVALGSQNGSAVLHVMNLTDSSSLLRLANSGRNLYGLDEAAQVVTSVSRLDDYRQASGLQAPDLIKLDVQGYELEVLAGAPAALSTAKALIVEVSFMELYKDQSLIADLCAFLAARQFHIQALAAPTPLGVALAQADVLFVRRSSSTPVGES